MYFNVGKNVFKKFTVVEGIEEPRVPFNTEIRCTFPVLVKICSLTIIFLIKLQYFSPHSRKITPPHFRWAKTRGPLLTVGTIPFPDFPFAVSPKNSRVGVPVPHSSTRNSLPGTSVVFGGGHISSPSPPPPTPRKAGEMFHLPVRKGCAPLKQFVPFNFMATDIYLIRFCFSRGNYKLNLIYGPPSTECIIHSWPCITLCLASLHSIHVQDQSLQELGRGIGKHGIQLLLRIVQVLYL